MIANIPHLLHCLSIFYTLLSMVCLFNFDIVSGRALSARDVYFAIVGIWLIK